MATQYLYVICVTCGGDGEHPASTFDENGNPIESGMKECDKCEGEGEGKILWGYLEDELLGEE